MKTFWTTFYSYKGGVGRSLALANVAALLVKRGHRVVLLDFDLEAPGLDTFTEFVDAKERPGIVEYVADFQRRLLAPEITPFVHAVRIPYLRGKLWIMPAGRKDKAYNHLLARTRWAELFEKGHGAPFIENWKLSIEQQFQPDYVLIDSRTGLTEIGGVCTTAFPDLVVMLFGLNEQNIEGTAAVARHIREANLERTPQLHFVATPVPNLPPDKTGLLGERLEAAKETLGIEAGRNLIRYWPPAALTERLFVLDESIRDLGLTHDHKALCDKVSDFNRNGLDFLSSQSKEAIKADDVELAGKLAAVLTREFGHRPEALFQRSRLARLDNNIGDPVGLAEQAFALDPTYKDPFDFLCAHYRRAKQYDRIEAMCEHLLGLSSRLSPTRRCDVLTTLGQLQMSLGKYLQAAQHYKEVLGSLPDNRERPPLLNMVYQFNASESARRAGQNVPISVWQNILQIFESFPITEGPPRIVANHIEAMHIPYALTGQISQARSCLRKAQRIAETVNDLEVMFSVRDYKDVSRAEFRIINEDLLAALERGELWDGTKLPTTESDSRVTA